MPQQDNIGTRRSASVRNHHAAYMADVNGALPGMTLERAAGRAPPPTGSVPSAAFPQILTDEFADKRRSRLSCNTPRPGFAGRCTPRRYAM